MSIVAELSYDDIANGTLPDASHTKRLREAVAAAAATMATPPFNTPPEKLTKAMDLVLTGKVTAHTDGTSTVTGSKPYEITDRCACYQGQHGASKWCKHLTAVALWKRTQEQLYGTSNGNGTPSNGNGMTNGATNGHTTWVERAKAHPVLTPDAPPARHWTDALAPVTHTVKYTVEGIEHAITVRGDDVHEVLSQVQALTGLVQHAKASEPTPGEPVPFCTTHHVSYERHSNDKGTWYSHKAGDGWCRYRPATV